MTAVPWDVVAGFCLDLAVGDPRCIPHPVRGFGWLAVRFERLWRRTGLPLRAAGVLFLLACLGSALLIVWLTLPWANIYWIWALLAVRDLDVQSVRVVRALERSGLPAARAQLAMIVGRDTQDLDEPEILRAAIETVSENLSDGVVAPLFYLAIAGPLGMAAYKAINTLDSMVGYRNERYKEFGWASARMDDVANFLPARLTAALIWLCAVLLRNDLRRSVKVTLRDAAKQPSPNSGYPEAAMAGALGIRLGGLNHYAGVPSRMEYLGDAIRPLTRDAFADTRRMLYAVSILMAAIVIGVLAW
ncbi:MAG: adenosylcobinamide-phosphate synthase CbiB [Bryobacteraceae bacterium]